MFSVKSKNENCFPFSVFLSSQEYVVTIDESLALFNKMQDIATSVAGDMTEKDIEKDIENEIKATRIELKNKTL